MTKYFTSTAYHPKALLRRTNTADEAFVADVWRPTRSIVDWLVGHDDFVEEVTEAQARALAPGAFTRPS